MLTADVEGRVGFGLEGNLWERSAGETPCSPRRPLPARCSHGSGGSAAHHWPQTEEHLGPLRSGKGLVFECAGPVTKVVGVP